MADKKLRWPAIHILTSKSSGAIDSGKANRIDGDRAEAWYTKFLRNPYLGYGHQDFRLVSRGETRAPATPPRLGYKDATIGGGSSTEALSRASKRKRAAEGRKRRRERASRSQ